MTQDVAKCVHCGEPIFDNGTVYVHLRVSGNLVIHDQWCEQRRCFAEPRDARLFTVTPTGDASEYPRIADPVKAFYTRFREAHGIKSGTGLGFDQWMQFACEYANHCLGVMQRAQEVACTPATNTTTTT